MKFFLTYFLYMLLLGVIVCACNDGLDIQQDYGYGVETLPLPRSLEQGETVDLEFSIIREGYYSETEYCFRYFISEGEGVLTYKGESLPVNRFTDDFVSACTMNSSSYTWFLRILSAKGWKYSITFSGERAEDKEPEADGD